MMPDPWSPILCGFIFGFSPTLVSFLYLSRFQHRFLIFRMSWLPALVPIISSVLLLLSDDPHGWTWRAIWLLTAVLTPYTLELMAAAFLRQSRWKPLVEDKYR
jgi:MFS family permease